MLRDAAPDAYLARVPERLQQDGSAELGVLLALLGAAAGAVYFSLGRALRPRLSRDRLGRVYHTLERPLLPVLRRREHAPTAAIVGQPNAANHPVNVPPVATRVPSATCLSRSV